MSLQIKIDLNHLKYRSEELKKICIGNLLITSIITDQDPSGCIAKSNLIDEKQKTQIVDIVKKVVLDAQLNQEAIIKTLPIFCHTFAIDYFTTPMNSSSDECIVECLSYLDAAISKTLGIYEIDF